MIDNTSVVIEFVKSFAIITRKEAGDGPYLKKKDAIHTRLAATRCELMPSARDVSMFKALFTVNFV